MFSVIIPLFNKAAHIENAIRSILNQNFQAFEIIVVDDGSTDNSFALLLDVSSKLQEEQSIQYEKIKLIRQENQGVSSARNNGVKLAKYDYIAFLDADDWWAPDYLFELAKLIDKYPEAGIYASSYYKVKQGRCISAQIGVTESFIDGYFNYFYAYSISLWMPIWTGAAVIPKFIFNKMGGFNPQLKLGEDFDLWVRIALEYKTVLLNKPKAYYNQDVDINARAVVSTRLYDKESHYIFNLGYLEKEEKTNINIKLMLDRLRIYVLFPYFISKTHHEIAKVELSKVDWEKQLFSIKLKYMMPRFVLRVFSFFLNCAVKSKQLIIKNNK